MAAFVTQKEIYNYIKIHCGYDIHPLRTITNRQCFNDICNGYTGKINLPGANVAINIPCYVCFNRILRSGQNVNDDDELTCGGIYKFPYINKKGFSCEEKFVENYKYILNNPHILRDKTITPFM
jgi:hypothetical protein